MIYKVICIYVGIDIVFFVGRVIQKFGCYIYFK